MAGSERIARDVDAHAVDVHAPGIAAQGDQLLPAHASEIGRKELAPGEQGKP
jgi:hypothetical protein